MSPADFFDLRRKIDDRDLSTDRVKAGDIPAENLKDAIQEIPNSYTERKDVVLARVAVSPDRTMLLTASRQDIRLWRAPTSGSSTR